ncbi:MAG: Creatinine amidohydrolase [Proteiniphilum sp.]|jgi:creatinine amidohydrolase|nr:Creatinine amidohydrolase [Proteiniphilum sp.]
MRLFTIFFALFCIINIQAQNLSIKMEELSAPQFVEAVEKSANTVILPIGVFEKHGPHMPLGTDLYTAREIALRAAEKDYTVVFPWYYFSQINEARHQPGTIAYSPTLIWDVLQETLNELSRNGFKKIIIVNGHGGNNAFLNYFGMAQLSERKDYALYWFQPSYDPEVIKRAEALTQHDPYDQHAGNRETSMVKAIVPNLVHPEKAGQQSGVDLDRLNNLPHVYSGIWWYASYPNHYSGDGSKANAEAGELILNSVVDQFVETIRSVKSDKNVPELQEQFFRESENPLETGQ